MEPEEAVILPTHKVGGALMICGSCANSALPGMDPVAEHERCAGRCACRLLGHDVLGNKELAERIAKSYSSSLPEHTVEWVRERHGGPSKSLKRKRAPMSAEQRAAAAERLVRARAAKAAKAADTLPL